MAPTLLASRAVVFGFAIWCSTIVFCSVADAASGDGTPPPIALPKFDAPASMDGAIDASWRNGARVFLATDFTNRRAAAEATDVVIARDGDAIDVAFDVTEGGQHIASQQTNGSAVFADDYVGVYFWPQGSHGFGYAFVSNPRGARFQTSSENSSYAPQWTAVARETAAGYAVTMRVPLTLIRSGGSDAWKVQFVRQTVGTNSLDVWTYSKQQSNVADPVYAGTITGVTGGASVASRPKARAQVYALGERTTPSQGGSTSRVGVDLSIPVTPTSSLVASAHPDYSNVEVDQQTISPSAFAYQYAEVRPFFTQAAQSFDQLFSCSNCPTILYTPSIPTYRDGYAYEGTQGPVSFAAFDTVGEGRNDAAEVASYSSQTAREVTEFSLQRVASDVVDGVHDEATSVTSGYQNRHTHVFAYANAAIDRGSNVGSPGDGNYLEMGLGVATATTAYGINYQQVGARFAPADGFVAQNDIKGYESFYRQTFNLSARDVLHDVSIGEFAGEYHNRYGLRAQEYAMSQINLDFRNLTTVRFTQSESAVRIGRGEFVPFDGNGVLVGYRYATATPTYVQFGGGPYYHGKLDAWSYVSTLGLAPNIHLRLESDEDDYLTTHASEARTVLWLDRASLDWQVSRQATFDIGARRLVGTPLPGAFGLATAPPLGAGNVTAAFHLLQQQNEFYVVYGDPNSLATKPALYMKWIRYIGAPKGT